MIFLCYGYKRRGHTSGHCCGLRPGETLGLMEPLLIGSSSRHRGALTDVAIELAAQSAGFRRSLPEGVLTALADLVRAMNCYYSNLIEGHDTWSISSGRSGTTIAVTPRSGICNSRPRPISRSSAGSMPGGLRGRSTTVEGLCKLHRRSGELLPDTLLWVEDPDTHERLKVVPGALRTRDVKVGKHVAVSPGRVPRFLARFQEAYRRLGTTDAMLAAAAAHHRLLLDPPVSRRQRPCGPADVTRDAARDAGYRCALVCRSGTGAPCPGL